MAFEDAGHLPNNRDGQPAEPRRLPRQRRGVTPQMHGRYPDHDVLAQSDRWDEPTRSVVIGRLGMLPPTGSSSRSRSRRWRRSATRSWPRTRILASRCCATSTTTSPSARLHGFQLRGHARRPRDLAHRRPRPGRGGGGGGGAAASPAVDAAARDAVIAAFADGDLRDGAWDRAVTGTCMVGRHRRHRHRLLRPPVGVERDRVRRSRVSARVHAAGRKPARAVGGSGSRGARRGLPA